MPPIACLYPCLSKLHCINLQYGFIHDWRAVDSHTSSSITRPIVLLNSDLDRMTHKSMESAAGRSANASHLRAVLMRHEHEETANIGSPVSGILSAFLCCNQNFLCKLCRVRLPLHLEQAFPYALTQPFISYHILSYVIIRQIPGGHIMAEGHWQKARTLEH